MTKRAGSSNWSLELTEYWEVQQDPECFCFTRAEGVGALQVSAAVKDGVVTDGDLREFAEDHLRDATDTKEISLGDFSGFELSYRDGDTAWRIWYLRSDSLALFITYNCDVTDTGVEDEKVDTLLVTLKRQ